MKYLGTVICRRAIVDKDSMTLSLIDLVDRIQVVGLPAEFVHATPIPIQLSIVTMWRIDAGEPTKVTDTVTLFGPKDFRSNLGFYEHDGPGVQRIALNLNALPIVGAGTYRFVVERRDPKTNAPTKLDEVSVEIVAVTPPAATPTSP